MAQPPASNQLPQGPNVTAGHVSVTTSGSSMTVNQGTSQAIVNWTGFDIGSQASVTIVQPSSSSAILNRVLSTNPTQIYGHLSANGQVVLINPQGIVFGGGSIVDVGSLVASTMDIADNDFLAGNYNFVRNGATGSVVNQGTITAHAPGGYVALLGLSVSNQGTITTASGGGVALAAGDAVSLPMTGSGLITLDITPATAAAAVENGSAGVIAAPNGQIYLNAAAANSYVASVMNSGSLSGAQVTVKADGPSATVTLADTSTITAGDSSGNGGSVLVISGGDTQIAGTITAQATVAGATPGNVETSGQTLEIGSATVQTDNWLIDPFDLTVGAAGATTISNSLNSGNVKLPDDERQKRNQWRWLQHRRSYVHQQRPEQYLYSGRRDHLVEQQDR